MGREIESHDYFLLYPPSTSKVLSQIKVVEQWLQNSYTNIETNRETSIDVPYVAHYKFSIPFSASLSGASQMIESIICEPTLRDLGDIYLSLGGELDYIANQ